MQHFEKVFSLKLPEIWGASRTFSGKRLGRAYLSVDPTSIGFSHGHCITNRVVMRRTSNQHGAKHSRDAFFLFRMYRVWCGHHCWWCEVGMQASVLR